MRYATASGFRAALEQRLATSAKQQGIPLVGLRKLAVFDRLMARLLVAAPRRWVLKGALALQYRVWPRLRTTKDMDLGRQDTEEEATADFLSAESVELADYFTFAVERTRGFDLLVVGGGVRYHVRAQLAGRPFEDVTVDVGFGDPTLSGTEQVTGPDLLSFAGIRPAQVPAISLEQHVAEKVHAYTRSYAGGSPSTRVKDLIDLAVISSLFALQARRLRHALEATFASRETHVLPTALPPQPPQWGTPYRRMAAEVGLDLDVSEGLQRARACLDPVLRQEADDEARWDPLRHSW